jgi:hypothetical protein
MASFHVRRLMAVAAALGAACGGDSGGGPTTPLPRAVATVSVSVPPGTVVPGLNVQLTATLRDAAGTELTDRAVTWSSSDEDVAIVAVTGEATALAAGRATLTATSEGRSGSAVLTVREGGLVGPAGGTVTALDGDVQLVVPQGAVAAPTAITVERAASLPPNPSLVVESGFVVGPADVVLASPAEIQLAYDPARGPSGVAEDDLRVHRLGGAGPEALGGEVDAAANVARAPVTGLGTFAVGRARPSQPCTAAEHRQFDFWVGEWTVQVAGAPSGAPPPPSDITLEPGGCAVFENFANGAGTSINVYSPETGSWHQTFVFSNGQRLILIGGREGELMVLERPSPPGSPGSFERWTWDPLPGGRVRQFQQVSTDGGQTVQTFFDGTYVPR